MSTRPDGQSLISRRDALRITAAAGLSLATAGSLWRRARLHRITETRTAMGTVVTLTLVHPDPLWGRETVARVFAEIERLEQILSHHRPDTALSVLNRQGHVASAPPEFLQVLQAARSVALETGGAFDPTVHPLLELYTHRYGAGTPPGPDEIQAALALVDHRALRWAAGSVHLGRPGMGVTLDGIAKGYVVDRTVDLLVDAGAERVLVDAGGDMASGGGDVQHEAWRVALQDPRTTSRALDRVGLSGGAVATSGDYMRTFTEDRSAHHILDPRSGHSPRLLSGVSVLAASAMEADALSTAVMVMGPEAGLALLELRGDVEGLLVTKEGQILRTSGFDARRT